jgi:tRNA A37 threonylcarbamoyladenosine synthetase subunit TsaC/SUA5/YrdC
LQKIKLGQSSAPELAYATMLSECPVIMVEMRSVYGLIAPNTLQGIEALHRIKKRLPGKTYGSIFGNPEALSRLCNNAIPSLIDQEGFILRIPVTEAGNKEVTRAGTHQILFENSTLKNFISLLEDFCISEKMSLNFNRSSYAGPLCTSANISGATSGSITNHDSATSFCNESGIPLMIETGMMGENLGSYPIFSFENNQFTIERDGPDSTKLLESLRLSLR